MAKVKINPIVERISGAIGDLVFRRQNNRMILARKGDMSNYVPTEAQIAQRDRFRDATAYAVASMDEPDAREYYALLGAARGYTGYVAAVTDFLLAPQISEIDVSGYVGQVDDFVVVRARDESGIERVEVSVIAADGTVIESGDALQLGNAWMYTATAAAPQGTTVTVRARVFDRPGNVTTGTQEVEIPA